MHASAHKDLRVSSDVGRLGDVLTQKFVVMHFVTRVPFPVDSLPSAKEVLSFVTKEWSRCCPTSCHHLYVLVVPQFGGWSALLVAVLVQVTEEQELLMAPR